MKVIKLGDRTQKPAFFDMACRFKPSRSAHWYGKGFRIGDRAGAYAYLGEWRARNPDRRLVVVEDNHIEGTGYSRWLPASWLFKDIADEVWCAESATEKIEQPDGEALYRNTLWAFWKTYMKSDRKFKPDIIPDDPSERYAKKVLNELKVPENFATIQPLFDASYDKHRNCSPKWWETVIRGTVDRVPVVVLGVFPNAKHMNLPHKAYPVILRGVDPMVTLAMIRRAVVHVGGATGTTLWAPIFGVPTVAVYKKWESTRQTDVRPISFGKPVVFSPSHDTPGHTSARIVHVYKQVYSNPIYV